MPCAGVVDGGGSGKRVRVANESYVCGLMSQVLFFLDSWISRRITLIVNLTVSITSVSPYNIDL